MTYQEAIIITKAFDTNSGKKAYEKTEAELKAYGEACIFLKNFAS